VNEQFAGAVLLEEYPTLLSYEVPRHSITLISEAFRVLEANKSRIGVDDYVLSQSTLEQVRNEQLMYCYKSFIKQIVSFL
jgi:hypothetical protein